MPPLPPAPWHQAHWASKTRRPAAMSLEIAAPSGRDRVDRVWAGATRGVSAAATKSVRSGSERITGAPPSKSV